MYEPPPSNLNVTHPALHIRNASDVLVVLEAVRRGILPLITRRLSGSDRDQLRNGNVYVWEESLDEGGLVRWTDGRRWSQSKVSAECLLYEEKVEVTDEEREAKARRRAQRICNPGTSVPPPRRNQRPSKSGGLTKQTYSFLVRLPGSDEYRKWHTVAYTLWSDRAALPVVGDYPDLRDIRVPVGVFARKATDTVTTTYLSPDLAEVNQEGPCGTFRPATRPPMPLHLAGRPSASNAPLTPLPPTLPSFSPQTDGATGIVLPPVSSLKPLRWSHSATRNYHGDPVSQEDRRMLDRFQLRL